eukprot:gene14944-17663_t
MVCGICNSRLLSVSVQPVIGMKDLCIEQKTYTCPLCTDTRKRSMLELLQHVDNGECASVIGKTLTLTERSLRDTRDCWVDILCDGLCGADAQWLVQGFLESSQRKVCAERDEACDRVKELEQDVLNMSGELRDLKIYKNSTEDYFHELRVTKQKCDELSRTSEIRKVENDKLLKINTNIRKDIAGKNSKIRDLESELEKLKGELDSSKENVRVLRGNIIEINSRKEDRGYGEERRVKWPRSN